MSEQIDFLKAEARKSYLGNIIVSGGKKYLPAGPNQFKTLWVRDFCYAVPGLLSAAETQLVFDQLDLILSATHTDGLLPRGLDVVNPKWRVILNTVLRFLPKALKRPSYEGKKLHIEYKGEHGTRAFDSLLLVPWAVLELYGKDQVKGEALLAKYQKHFVQIFAQLQASIRDGAFYQEPFSDWQDSTRREGAIFTSHVLFLRLLKSAQRYGLNWFTKGSWPTEESIFKKFWRDGVFQNSLVQHNSLNQQISLEAHLWVIQDKVFLNQLDHQELYKKLKASELWKRVGIPVCPPSPEDQVAWTTKLVGLRGYHDGMVWSWLLAEAYKTAKLMNDEVEAETRLSEIVTSVRKDGYIFEVYEGNPGPLVPVQNLLYKSEHPFSWGACKWLEALSFGS